jgi:hypothetical protein
MMRDPSEIQRAHDILHFLGTDGAPAVMDEEGAVACSAAHDVLAWMLGYPCGETFQENVEGILTELQRLGYREIDIGKPISTDEAKARGLV